MVTTNSKRFWKYMWSYKDHGKSYEKITGSNLTMVVLNGFTKTWEQIIGLQNFNQLLGALN